MDNRLFPSILCSLAFLLGLAIPYPGGAQTGRPVAPEATFPVFEAGILELQEAMASGAVTSVGLVQAYTARIAAYERGGPALNSILRLNPDALRAAEALDRERSEGRVRGPMHGIPVLLKDNYDTADLPTTGATLALAGFIPPDDAYQVRRLREAGAVILGKTNLHELASGITTISSLGGQTRNPYDPGRNPGGSSGGTGAAIAASFATVGWGSDTCGSIRIPAAANNLVGLRPTKGLSSVDGIMPLSHSQDTGGPLARSAMDLAIALDATVGHDPQDPATEILVGRELPSFVESLEGASLQDARIGALTPWLAGGETTRVVRRALQSMRAEGAEIVEIPFPRMEEHLERTGLISLEFKFDLADYLAAAPDAPVESLGRILELGLHHEALDGVFRSWNRAEERHSPEHRVRVERQAALRRALLDLLEEEDLDALAYPSIREEIAPIGSPAQGSSCSLSAHSGLPAISIPAGFTSAGVPVGLELLGGWLEDDRLLAYAHAFEQADARRTPPLRTPPLSAGRAPEPVSFTVRNESPLVIGTFGFDQAAGTLAYDVQVEVGGGSDVHGITLERADDGRGPPTVVQRLAGPGTSRLEGTLDLSPSLLRELVEGSVRLGVYTARAPLGAVRIDLDPLARTEQRAADRSRAGNGR